MNYVTRFGLVLVVAGLFSLSACGGGGSTPSSSGTSGSTSSGVTGNASSVVTAAVVTTE